jgi:hypothetical protein
MPVFASAVPILPGKADEWKQFAKELQGSHRAEYEASRRRVGLTKEVAVLQRTPMGDFAVIYGETIGDPVEANRALGTSAEPFDVWFRQKVMELHGLDLTQPPPGPQPEVCHEWNAPA